MEKETKDYILEIFKGKDKKAVAIKAYDNNHAQAQALDISRALCVDRFSLSYQDKNKKEDTFCELLKRLAFSDFKHKECFNWSSSYTNESPVIYLFKKRFYIRPLILDYMDMNRDNFVKMVCKNKKCVNPYHFSYAKTRASRLTCGDKKMMLAFASQGVSAQQIAEALNVHRSTIYRTLNNEHLHSGSESNRHSST